MAQLAEQLICNQQVIGSSPIIGFMGEFPSGQRGQTVNLLAVLSMVRIPSGSFIKIEYFYKNECGILAQLGEHLPYKQRVTGSSPVGPISF